jgi:hypothetical protein
MTSLHVLFILAALGSPQTGPAAASDASRREIYQIVINRALQEFAGGKVTTHQIVVTSTTCAELTPKAKPEQVARELQKLVDSLSGILPSDDPVIVSFLAENRIAQPLPKDLKLSMRPVLRGPRSRRESWGEFYERYPDAAGEICVSAIGFDDTASRALVYLAHTYGLVGGHAELVILMRDELGWRIQRTVPLWVS